MPRPTSQDLAGFWDLLQLSIDDVTAKFDELQQIKNNQWQLVESPEKKVQLVTVFPVIIYTVYLYNQLSYNLFFFERPQLQWCWGVAHNS